MSSNGSYADFGREPYGVYTPAENLTNYVGHAMRVITGNTVGPCSLTDQPTTNQQFGIGVLIEGGEVDPYLQVRVVQMGAVRAKAGTGGVTAGALLVPEFSSTPANRGRFRKVTAAELEDGVVIWGEATEDAAANGEFIMQLNRREHLNADLA